MAIEVSAKRERDGRIRAFLGVSLPISLALKLREIAYDEYRR
jgi:hypothetical protein